MKQSITKYGWTYSFDGEGNKFEIIPPTNIANEVPKTLFKYYDLGKNSIDAITKNYLYAPHPKQFNDVFDCYENLIQIDNIEIAYNLLKVQFPDITHQNVKDIIEGKNAKLNRDFHYSVLAKTYGLVGILSMINKPEDICMWSYYSNHRGFCVEFDYKQFPFNFQGPFQINYQETLEPISIKDLQFKTENSCFIFAFLYQTNIKQSRWQHEEEWRLLLDKGTKAMFIPGIYDKDNSFRVDRKFIYNSSNIKSITLGNRFFYDDCQKPQANGVLHFELKDKTDEKKSLLEIIQTLDCKTYMMGIDEKNFNLKQQGIKITQIEENKFEIICLPHN